jgi:hypothetical protein
MGTTDVHIAPITTDVQEKEWDEFSSHSAVGHMQQCLWWTQPLAKFGIATRVLGCWRAGKLIGGSLFRSIPIPYLGRSFAECLCGPIFLDWRSDWADLFLRGLQEIAEEFNSVSVSIRGCPNKEVHQDLGLAFERNMLRTTWSPGAAEAILPLKGRTTEDLWKDFRKGTKWSVKKGLKGPLRVERLTSRADLRQAYEAWIATAKRKRFPHVRPWSSLEPALCHCVENRLGYVLGTFLDGNLLGSAFVSYIGGTGAWVYGGYMDNAAAHQPTHILQYHAIQESLERGMNGYTFGELSLQKDSSYSGTDQFKLGFGARPERNLDTIVWERRPYWTRVLQWMQTARGNRVGRQLERILRKRLVDRSENRACLKNNGIKSTEKGSNAKYQNCA